MHASALFYWPYAVLQTLRCHHPYDYIMISSFMSKFAG